MTVWCREKQIKNYNLPFSLQVSLPSLVPEEKCRVVPREVCQDVVVTTRTQPSLEIVKYCTTLPLPLPATPPALDERTVLDLRLPQGRTQKLRLQEASSPALDQGLSPPQPQSGEIQQLRQALALQQQQIAALLGPQQQQQQLFASPGNQQQQQHSTLIDLQQQQQQQQLLNQRPQQGQLRNNRLRGHQQQQQTRQQQKPKTLNFQRFQKKKKKQENSRNSLKSLSVFSQPNTGRQSAAKLQRDEFSRQRALRLLSLH